MPNLNLGFLLMAWLFIQPIFAEPLCQDDRKHHGRDNCEKKYNNWVSSAENLSCRKVGVQKYKINESFWGKCPPTAANACVCSGSYTTPPVGTRNADTGLKWQECTACNNYTLDKTWKKIGTTHERRETSVTCSDSWASSGVCTPSYEYRCTAGYYGTPTNGTSGCTQCPGGGTSPAGTTVASGCYISSGADVRGKYRFNPVCYYK